MRARAYSAVLDGPGRVMAIDARLGRGLPGLIVRGQRERDDPLEQRVRAALGRCGHVLEGCERVVDIPYVQPYVPSLPGLALACVAALLGAHGIVPRERLAGALLWGDLDDTGSLVPTPEVDRVAALAQREGLRELYLPAASPPSRAATGLRVVPITDVAELVAHLRCELPFRGWLGPTRSASCSLARVRGELEIMLAGRHHALAVVSGRDTPRLVRRLAALLPEPDECLAADRVALGSVGADPSARVHVLVPTISATRLAGQHPAAPGPACLAHGGVLVLDDLRRYPAPLLASVRALVRGHLEPPPPRPAEFVLLATIRPRKREPASLHCPSELDFVSLAAAREPTRGRQAIDSPDGARSRIALARARQLRRFGGTWPALAWTCNARIPCTQVCLDEFCPTSESGRSLLDSLTRLHGLSACRRADLLRVARTIADLDPDRDPRAPLDHECLAAAAMFMPRAP